MDSAVLDCDTTGLFSLMHDRLIEMAIVCVDEHDRTLTGFDTLINPGRDAGPTSAQCSY